jgi:tetratricopeptide (TPR) repeat protein
MERLPEERMRGLTRVLAKALGDGHPQAAGSRLQERALRQALGKAEPKPEYGSFSLSESTLSRLAEISEEKSLAPDRLSELMDLSPAKREAAVAVNPRFQTYTLASHVLRTCATAVFRDPAAARSMARLAYSIATQVDPRTCGGSAALADLQAYALAMEGNATRVSGDLEGALVFFERARQIQERGGADPDLAARINHLEASLRRDLRQYDEALRLLDRAGRAFQTLQDHDQKARTFINRSNVFLVKGDYEEAIATLQGALDVACSSELALTVRHNLIDILIQGGRPQEAAVLFAEAQPLYAQHTDPLTTCRRIWAEGRIVRELGEDLDRAAVLLQQASQLQAEYGYSAGAALAGLDLVGVYAIQGKATEVLRTASELVQLFQARKAHPETLAALSLVHQAARQQTLNLSLLSHASSLIQKSGRMYEIAVS